MYDYLEKSESDEVPEEYFDEIATLLSKQGLPIDYEARKVSKSKMIREFQLAKHRVLKKLLITLNVSLSGLKIAIDQ